MSQITARSAITTGVLSFCIGAPAFPVLADNIQGAERILCAAHQATRCGLSTGCKTAAPQNWNIPDFIEIDLANKHLRTTVASGQKRATPFTTLLDEEGAFYIQGVDQGRAYSIVIDQETGELTAATVRGSHGVFAYAACTPLPIKTQN